MLTKQFIFIVGAPGSGTTLLLKILSNIKYCVGLGGNYITLEHPLVKKLSDETTKLWDRHNDYNDSSKFLQIVKSIDNLSELRGITHLIYKRSYPFASEDRFFPKLADIDKLHSRIIWCKRDPRCATWSFCRNENDLERKAKMHLQFINNIKDELESTKNSDYYTYDHNKLCDKNTRASVISNLSKFCQLSYEEVANSAKEQNITNHRNLDWLKISKKSQDFLNKIFKEMI